MNLRKNPKTLVLDIETLPMVAYVWGRKDVNIALNQIKEEWSVMAWAAKWLNKSASTIISRDVRNQTVLRDDQRILRPLWQLLNEADILVTQNGKNFDSKKLNARFIMHGWTPPSPYKHLDTYQIARRVADFTSNKLEYLTDKLCTKYKKLSHAKFPGQSLWTECLNNNVAAWNEMKRYNIHDVLSTEELYQKLKAWAPETAPKPYEVMDVNLQCSICGKYGTITKNGTRKIIASYYQRLHCTDCGAWLKGDKIQ
jgi:DNA polymerase elongation subunit (family B)